MSPFTNVRKRLTTVFLMLLLIGPMVTQAQNESDLVTFLNAGEEDASKLMKAYLNPMIEGIVLRLQRRMGTDCQSTQNIGIRFDDQREMPCSFLPGKIILIRQNLA